MFHIFHTRYITSLVDSGQEVFGSHGSGRFTLTRSDWYVMVYREVARTAKTPQVYNGFGRCLGVQIGVLSSPTWTNLAVHRAIRTSHLGGSKHRRGQNENICCHPSGSSSIKQVQDRYECIFSRTSVAATLVARVARAGSMALTVLMLITDAAGLAEELMARAPLKTACLYVETRNVSPWHRYITSATNEKGGRDGG